MSKTAASGVVALIFMIVGFQAAIFLMKVIERPVEIPQDVTQELDNDIESTPNSESKVLSSSGSANSTASRQNKGRALSPNAKRSKFGGYEAIEKERPLSQSKVQPESFPFDPNIVTENELVRLGLSQRQAEVITNYRQKGGKFRKKSDFKKMYVVSDSLFARLEPFIEIPKVEINAADSASLVTLSGIGGYYALKIQKYRDLLGGFVSGEQLMEISGIDKERYDGFVEQIRVDTTLVKRFSIWELSADSLSKHPYIGSYASKGIVSYKHICDSSLWTIDNLVKNSILSRSNGEMLKKYQFKQAF